MRIILMIFCLLLFTCGKFNKHTIKPKEKILIGKILETDLKVKPYSFWFNSNYHNYKFNVNVINEIKPVMKDVKFKVFIGTWCSDSKRQIPRFYRLLDEIGFNKDAVELVAMDKSKSTPQNLEKGLNIFRVPTIIALKKGKEINRIVEIPVHSLETDLLNILTYNNYVHAYKKQ